MFIEPAVLTAAATAIARHAGDLDALARIHPPDVGSGAPPAAGGDLAEVERAVRRLVDRFDGLEVGLRRVVATALGHDVGHARSFDRAASSGLGDRS